MVPTAVPLRLKPSKFTCQWLLLTKFVYTKYPVQCALYVNANVDENVTVNVNVNDVNVTDVNAKSE